MPPNNVETPRFRGNPGWGRLLGATTFNPFGRPEGPRNRRQDVPKNPSSPRPSSPIALPPTGRRGSAKQGAVYAIGPTLRTPTKARPRPFGKWRGVRGHSKHGSSDSD